jgi:hypothetical protein
MNERFQMQGGKNRILPKEMNANRFCRDSHWLEIWSNHLFPYMGPNGGSVAMEWTQERTKFDMAEKAVLATGATTMYKRVGIVSRPKAWGLYVPKKKQGTEQNRRKKQYSNTEMILLRKRHCRFVKPERI